MSTPVIFLFPLPAPAVTDQNTLCLWSAGPYPIVFKMGNAGSNARERHKPGEMHAPSSPGKDGGQAFTFDKKPNSRLVYLSSTEEEEQPYYTKPTSNSSSMQHSKDHSADGEFSMQPSRPRSNTISEGSKIEEPPGEKVLPTVFKWDGGGKQVYISGTFTEWKVIPMVKSHGDFVTIIDLPEGEHQYKFMVDGEWKHDPSVKIIHNDVGTKNNMVSVKRSDFEVFQALAKDSESVSQTIQSDYCQEIPQNKPWEKVPGPPILPPHLLQVILNKDTPLSCEPTLLPEPNHVMLNHLYALSIKDGVMVLSATHRYRKKYVTTLLYKPI
ncbi:5'-AMP-activated protein kinase subunit beta-1 isoform X3 [Frankliniella occidentalis]|uniref:5'-AMP-activated protein kinase subunit beta-1 n=1 Tax=Frankliniella occidentalis TaxID=133901 RepID=A0A6J1SSW7_FRAOC|nr:5'-AMP-activated protein kinase subunit beta-1 isoform X3 [Frankliniella occidentalis]